MKTHFIHVPQLMMMMMKMNKVVLKMIKRVVNDGEDDDEGKHKEKERKNCANEQASWLESSLL